MTNQEQFFYSTNVPGNEPQRNYLIINMGEAVRDRGDSRWSGENNPHTPPPPPPPRKREKSITEMWALLYLLLAISVCCSCSALASFYMAMANPFQ